MPGEDLPLIAGSTWRAEQGNLAHHPDVGRLRAQLPHWDELRDGRVNLGIEVDERLIGEVQTFLPTDRAVGSGSAVCEVGISIYEVADRGGGLGVEAMCLFVDWLFKSGIEPICGTTASTSQAMRTVFEHTGVSLTGRATAPTSEALLLSAQSARAVVTRACIRRSGQ